MQDRLTSVKKNRNIRNLSIVFAITSFMIALIVLIDYLVLQTADLNVLFYVAPFCLITTFLSIHFHFRFRSRN